ncbi:MAG: PocR ligand-binding domain-containing protein [Clostridia bacterium]|nr:PocR ligand-binding domain-containing protein [Clostridia bacterium]
MTKDEIISVLAELNKITGFRVSLHGADYSEIAAYPPEKRKFCQMVHKDPAEYEKCVACDKAACKRALSDKSTHIYTCRYGFTEAVSPLYNFGTLTGFLMMGQVLETGEDGKPLHPEVKNIRALGEETAALAKATPAVDADMVRSYVKIMTICAQYLTLSNAIPSAKQTVAEMAKKYIFDNYKSKITIADICEEIGCSKSTLITGFKREYGTTVNSYITEVRLGEAVNMLKSGERHIGEIAAETGFSDQSYFSKVFSAKYGIPPSEYDKKKEQQGG